MNPRRLHRSRDRQLAGVAGGMAEYLDIDPTVVRILWVIAGFASAGLALIAYVILALVMPQGEPAMAPAGWAPTPGTWAPAPGTWAQAPGGAAPAPGWGTPPAAPVSNPGWTAGPYAAPVPQRAQGRGIGAAAIVGIVLVVFGAIALVNVVVPGWVSGAILGPAVILALGAALLASSLLRRPDEAPASTAPVDAAPAPAPVDPAPAAPAPAPAPATTVAAPWDVTDTQAVDTDEGSRPA